MKQKLLAITLRGAGISGRFLLIFFITRNISLEFQGDFSLISTNIAILIMLLGFDLYTFTNQVLVIDPRKATFVFKNSLLFFLFGYLLLIPVTHMFVSLGYVSSEIFWTFILLVILEHFSQELFRIYLAIERTAFANLLFFIRTGTWSWLLVLGLISGWINSLSIYEILLVWCFGAFISSLIGIVFLPSIRTFFKEKIDYKWIKDALKFASAVIISTLLLKAIEYSDRYFIDYFLGKKSLGVYMFFFQLANLVNVVIFTLYVSFIYPRIMKSVIEKDITGFQSKKNELYRSILITVAGFTIFFLLAMPYILELLQKDELYENSNLIYLMLLGILFLNFSFSSHFFLLADKQEKIILKITVITAFINVILNLILVPIFGIIGACISLIISSASLWLLKFLEEKKAIRKW
ncbi:polysaccharide biosynthesis C-terminal domain-containing protein [Flavobacteriaceae bacterium D16]|nr:polysaccharide biosynthesis C-terminal domain-containing protein [Flavobacteriaceae bacterium D16]